MKALIAADGTMEGWVGGSCTHPIVVREALAALGSGAPRLICLAPEGQDDGREGVIRHLMTCHSGGTLEIYIEPVLPKPQLLLIGEAPLVNALSDLGRLQGFAVWAVDAGNAHGLEARITPSTYVVVATMGTSDEEALEHVVGRGAAYVALVSSKKRAKAVFAYLRSRGVPPEQLQRIRVPAGLDIGAVTPEEIALSIVAEIIQVRRARPAVQTEAPATAGATDPVCGMTVEVAGAKHKADYHGMTYFFCCAHCKGTFEQDPEKYAMARA
jgi:xanthine dehydrogenase accessory factor